MISYIDDSMLDSPSREEVLGEGGFGPPPMGESFPFFLRSSVLASHKRGQPPSYHKRGLSVPDGPSKVHFQGHQGKI